MIDASMSDLSSFFEEGVAVKKQSQGDDANHHMKTTAALECPVKGMIPYPCCPRESAMVYLNAHGQVSTKCPRCGRFVKFDYDSMTAIVVNAIRGASHRYKNRT